MPSPEEWHKDFYRESGREITLAQTVLVNVQGWSITLTLGVTTAMIGIVTSVQRSDSTIPQPILFGVWLIALISSILLTRFFVRSAIALSTIHRWAILQKHWGLICREDYPCDHPKLVSEVEQYHILMRSARPMSKIFRDNLRLAYIWLYLLIGLPIIGGVFVVQKDPKFWTAIFSWSAMVLWEVYWFVDYHQFQHSPADEKALRDNQHEREQKERFYKRISKVVWGTAIGVTVIAIAQLAFVLGFLPAGL